MATAFAILAALVGVLLAGGAHDPVQPGGIREPSDGTVIAGVMDGPYVPPCVPGGFHGD